MDGKIHVITVVAHLDPPYRHGPELAGGLPSALAGVTTYWRRHRSSKVTGPRGPGTWSTLIPVSGTPRSLKPSSRRVLAFQKAPVPAEAAPDPPRHARRAGPPARP